MNKFFNKVAHGQPIEADRGASSIAGTEHVRSQIIQLFNKHSITSMFDAGCNDCSWAILLAAQINYCGADVNPGFIAMAKQHYPDLNVQCIDIRIEPLLPADCMMVRDVSIHFTNKEKTQLLQNFKKSKLQWLLITHIPSCNENLDLPETLDIVTADVNWTLPPWNFPQPIDTIDELYHGGRCLALWHRDQIESLI